MSALFYYHTADVSTTYIATDLYDFKSFNLHIKTPLFSISVNRKKGFIIVKICLF